MKKIIPYLLIFCLILHTQSFAESYEKTEDIDSYVIADYSTGNVISAHNQRTIVPITSLTKLMSFLIIMDEIQLLKERGLTDIVSVDVNAVDLNEPSYQLNRSENYSINQLLEAMTILSANDATKALAIYFEKTEDQFVSKINRKAKQLGMKDTTYYTSTGLSIGENANTSTAMDQLELLRYILRRYPVLLDFVKTPSIQIANGEWRNSSMHAITSLSPDMEGIIAGNSDAAGYCFAGSFILKQDEGSKRILLLSFGAESEESRTLNAESMIKGTRTFLKVQEEDAPTAVKFSEHFSTTSRIKRREVLSLEEVRRDTILKEPIIIEN